MILSLAALMALAAACHKDPSPEPNPNHPTDTINPVVPEPTYPDTVYVPFEFAPAIFEKNPNMDTIRFYADKPNVKKIIMDLEPMDSLYTSGCTWRAYDKEVDTLQKRIDIAPYKVIGRGTFIVERIIPDSITNTGGMPKRDSTALHNMGFDIFVRHNH
ncbi:MAG: hypothetical protein IKX35_07570 [Bacteroidales bacterium]|nr:hypothetical protein [Bacteroidales bacterium]